VVFIVVQDIMGLKVPFDCVGCLYEFSDQERLMLLPLHSQSDQEEQGMTIHELNIEIELEFTLLGC
jgi:hypothetical protein